MDSKATNIRYIVDNISQCEIETFPKFVYLFVDNFQDGMSGPLDSMRTLEQFLPGEQPRRLMGPDGGPKGNSGYILNLLDLSFFICNIYFKIQVVHLTYKTHII